MNNAIYTKEYFLVAGDADAQQELPLTTLTQRLIEIASLHANQLGFGHTAMEPMKLGWVLSRLSVEMKRFPTINRPYTISTWIESWTRHFSERCFEICGADGSVLGHARTVWMVIDTDSHRGAGTDRLHCPDEIVNPRECPIERMKRIPLVDPDADDVTCTGYTYRYTDIDFYRHVNTVKHIRTLLDTMTMDETDARRIVRADIAFMHEGRYGHHADILRHDDLFRVISDGETILTARMTMIPRI